jgi:hypothetical protein
LSRALRYFVRAFPLLSAVALVCVGVMVLVGWVEKKADADHHRQVSKH